MTFHNKFETNYYASKRNKNRNMTYRQSQDNQFSEMKTTKILIVRENTLKFLGYIPPVSHIIYVHTE